MDGPGRGPGSPSSLTPITPLFQLHSGHVHSGFFRRLCCAEARRPVLRDAQPHPSTHGRPPPQGRCRLAADPHGFLPLLKSYLSAGSLHASRSASSPPTGEVPLVHHFFPPHFRNYLGFCRLEPERCANPQCPLVHVSAATRVGGGVQHVCYQRNSWMERTHCDISSIFSLVGTKQTSRGFHSGFRSALPGVGGPSLADLSILEASGSGAESRGGAGTGEGGQLAFCL